MSRSSEDAWDEDLRRMLNEHQNPQPPADEPSHEQAESAEEEDATALATQLIREAFAKEPHRTREEWERLYNEADDDESDAHLN